MSPIAVRLARLVVRRPRRVLLGAALLAIAVAPAALRLRLDADPLALLPARLPAASAFARFAHLFGEKQLLVALVEDDDPARLTAFADRFAASLRARPDVASVRLRISPATAALLRDHLLDLLDDELDALAARSSPEALARQARRLRSLLAAPGGSSLSPLLAADPLELLPLVARRLEAGLPVDPASGYYRSPDGRALLVFARPRFSPFDFARSRALLDGTRAAAAALGADVDPAGTVAGRPTVRLTGPYAYALGWRDLLERDTRRSTAISAVAVLLFFALLLGAARALPLVAAPLALSLWLAAAVAAIVYGRVNPVSLAFGTLLLAIGIDLPIQLYNRLREELAERAALDALERSVAVLAAPALLATAGPAAVFVACALSDFPGLSHLGVLAGLGLLVNFAVMIAALPSLLALAPPRLWAPRRSPPRARRLLGLPALGRLAARRPVAVLALVALASIALVPFATRVRFERHLISIEPASMPAARAERAIERRFGGADLVVVLHEGSPDRALEASDRWRARAERLQRDGLLLRYESLSSLFPSPSEIARRRSRLAQLDPPRIARELRAALVEAGFDPAPFAPFLAQLEHPPPPLTLADAARPPLDDELGFLVRAHVKDLDGARVVATFLYPNPARLDEALAAIRAAPDSDGAVTGKPLLEPALRALLERDTRRVVAASIAILALLLAVWYRRLRPALAVLVPLGVAWLAYFATLALAGIPLDLFNLVTVPLVIGYGIDDHVFLVHRWEERPADRARAFASTGRAIVVTSLSTIAGFAGLAAARFDGLRRLGITGALAVALCLLAAFAVLPALLALLDRDARRSASPSAEPEQRLPTDHTD